MVDRFYQLTGHAVCKQHRNQQDRKNQQDHSGNSGSDKRKHAFRCAGKPQNIAIVQTNRIVERLCLQRVGVTGNLRAAISHRRFKLRTAAVVFHRRFLFYRIVKNASIGSDQGDSAFRPCSSLLHIFFSICVHCIRHHLALVLDCFLHLFAQIIVHEPAHGEKRQNDCSNNENYLMFEYSSLHRLTLLSGSRRRVPFLSYLRNDPVSGEASGYERPPSSSRRRNHSPTHGRADGLWT